MCCKSELRVDTICICFSAAGILRRKKHVYCHFLVFAVTLLYQRLHLRETVKSLKHCHDHLVNFTPLLSLNKQIRCLITFLHYLKCKSITDSLEHFFKVHLNIVFAHVVSFQCMFNLNVFLFSPCHVSNSHTAFLDQDVIGEYREDRGFFYSHSVLILGPVSCLSYLRCPSRI